MKISDLTAKLEDIKILGDIDMEIEGLAYDSRSVSQGYAFICISGFKTDGHNYINDALARGAAAIVVEKDVEIPEGVTKIKVTDTREALALMSAAYFGFPTRDIKLIGVTGTNGKTTTTYLIKSILDEAGFKTAVLGTISNIIGNQEFEAKRTTPESYDLHEMFQKMRDVSTEYCIMEASSHSLELKRVFGCEFNVGVFTNLTRDHLDFHRTFENYLNAKIKLFKQSKMAVVNIDDNYSQRVIENVKVPVITYSEKTDADIKALDVEITSTCSKFVLEFKKEKTFISLPLPGRFNVYNALAAASACLCEGISMEIIKKGLENIKGIPGRSQVVDSGRGFTIIIDYAHTPDGLENIINTVHEYAAGKVITVFGCGGDRDKTKRPLMGEIAGRLSDMCIVTSDNPRSEEPMMIIEDIIPGIKKTHSNYKVLADRREAIKEALSLAKAGDVVIIAGKGHETYQILKNETIHFDEKEIVDEILKNELCR